jgi:hypothetical protein
MITMSVPNRPFASEMITGLALPDGIFETTLGVQRVNAYFSNQGASALSSVNIYVESVSDPGIVITPRTYSIAQLGSNGARLLSWQADFSLATPGVHRISFIAENAAGRRRIIKKIFVTKVSFDPTTRTFSAVTPEGQIRVGFKNFLGPKNAPCCGSKERPKPFAEKSQRISVLDAFKLFRGEHRPDFQFCLREYLLQDFEVVVTPTPAFAGQYGDLPFQDPWWKIVLCIIAVLLLIAAAIAEAVDGTGNITVGGGSGGSGSPAGDCCGVEASGGGTSYIAAGLVAAAAAAATAAGLSDARDPFRRGQDNTMPASGEMTVGERLEASLMYPEAVELGRPFAVQTKWEYTRITTGKTYSYSVSETNNNVHVLERYEIEAPDVVRLYKREPFIVKARFFGPDEKQFRGGELFVQCFLLGPNGEFRSFHLQDDGINPDEKPNDGTYSGVYLFSHEKNKGIGLWTYFVIAQDVNSAAEGMNPEDAAQIIGGMVVTHQLTISFSGGTCPLVPDGHVNVV